MYILITFYVNLSRNRKKIKNYQRILYINADHIMDRKNGLLKKSSIKIDKKKWNVANYVWYIFMNSKCGQWEDDILGD